jgi:hypothetical protein
LFHDVDACDLQELVSSVKVSCCFENEKYIWLYSSKSLWSIS